MLFIWQRIIFFLLGFSTSPFFIFYNDPLSKNNSSTFAIFSCSCDLESFVLDVLYVCYSLPFLSKQYVLVYPLHRINSSTACKFSWTFKVVLNPWNIRTSASWFNKLDFISSLSCHKTFKKRKKENCQIVSFTALLRCWSNTESLRC